MDQIHQRNERCPYLYLFVGVLAALVGLATPARAQDEAVAPAEDETPSLLDLMHGDITTRWIYRLRDDESDQDIFVSFHAGGKNAPRGRVSYQVSGLWTIDIDGRETGEIFADRGNTFGGNDHLFLYSTWAQVEDVPDGYVERVRVGRQFVFAPETFHFDGASVETASFGGVTGRGLVGVPVHLYESSPSGDFIAGGGLQYRPYPNVKVGGDYIHLVDDKFELGEFVEDLYYLHGSALLLPSTRLGTTLSWVDSQFRRWHVRAHSYAESIGLGGGLIARYQPTTVEELAADVSPFYQAVFESRPYWQVIAYLEKEISEPLSVEVGGGVRQLLDDDDEGPYNHEFTRLYVTGHLRDVGMEKLDLSVTGESWFAEQDVTYSTGFDLTYRPSKEWRASTGYYYSLFKIDRVTFDERENVHTVFVRLKGPIAGPLGFQVRYELEDGRGPVYHIADLGLKVTF